ncbi:MAG: TonB-dependent receptor [Gammaproteobacteria bacterium]|jgi:outer membrane receptor protein involved in Fe transport|nr:TonB-dependent receptor [Gammaproteobacteria bacterium]
MNIKTIPLTVLALITAAIAAPVIAQEQVTIMEEILVTAAKREQTLQQVPIAVSVVSAEVMNEAQVLDIKDLQFLVPSLRVSQLQTSANATFLIRGFGNGANNAGVEPSVGVFIDGVYRSRSASSLADFPNLERIEVIKGPQSTLFGKNASAGVINVITQKPSLDGYLGSVSATFGDYSQVIVKGDVTGPFSDTVAFSLSGSYNQRDGYFTNLETGGELNELDRYSVRGQLLFAPSDTFEARLIADYDNIEELCCGVAHLADGVSVIGIRSPGVGGDMLSNQPFSYTGLYNFDAANKVENSGVSLQLDWDLNDNIALTSITAFRNLERFDNADSDFTTATLLSETASNLTDTKLDTFTQEFRLSGSTEHVDWLVGAFYFDEDVEQNSGALFGDGARPYVDTMTKLLGVQTGDYTFPEALNPAVPSPITALEFALSGIPGSGVVPGLFFAGETGTLEAATLSNQAVSLFAQVDFALTDRSTITLGANYTEDEKDVAVSTLNNNVFSYLDLVDVGGQLIFGQVLQNLVLGGQCPEGATDPTCLAIAQGAAADGQGVLCADVAEGVPCNPVLPLTAVQILPPFANFPNSIEPGTSKDDQTTWTARIAYDLTDDLNAYVSAGTGFKATSWNLSRDSRPLGADIPALEAAGISVPNLMPGTRFAAPEDSSLLEAGLKGQFDRVSFNLAIFNQEIEGFQENVFQGTGFVLTNAGKQSTSGVEVDLLWALTDNFEWFIAGTFLDPVYDDYQDGPGIGGPTNLSGTKVPGVAETSINTWARYSFDLGASISGFVRAEYYYESETQVISNVPASVASREVSMVNASLGLGWQNGFEVMLWGRNLTNDEYLQSAFPTTFQNLAQPFTYSGYPNQPRTYGLTLRKYFD